MSVSIDKPIYKILEQLKTQVFNLLDDLLEICPNEADILQVRLYFEIGVDAQMLMDGFILWVLPWADNIKRRDEKFFEENDHIFGSLPIDKVKRFKDLYKNGTFNDEDKKIIWNYFDVFLMLINKYNKLK